VIIFMKDHASPNPEELKRLHAWAMAHCLPGMLCDECKTAFDDPFPCDRFVKVDITGEVFLLYVTCGDCNERYESCPERGFPNCHADGERIKDRLMVMHPGHQQVVIQ